MESIVTCCLKKCPWSVLHVWFFIIMESAVQVCLMFQEKPSLGINASSDPTLQELGVHLHLEIIFFAVSRVWLIIPSCQLLGSNFLLYQLLNLCISKLRVISWMKSNPLVRIIFKLYLFSLSLETRLNLRLPVETGIVYCPVVNCLSFMSSFRYTTNCNEFATMEYTVQYEMYPMWFSMSHHSPCVECLPSSCFVTGQIYLLAGMTWYFSFWSKVLWDFLLVYHLSMSMLIFPT